ncbi:MAG: MHS family MFS transporter [Planctomycetia bacterium]|nr:MHS family MFS transporter [Planctomycetia bacterium]
MSTREPDAAAPTNTVARVVLASLIGTTIEWYDFFLYATAAALVFNEIFFPTFDSLAGTMASFATYAVGFFARPVGAVVFGHFGDRMGRKSMLVTTLMLMGMATFLIGVLPTYGQIGAAAPALLVLLRFVQGFGVGGEWGGAVLMVVEHGHHGRRGLNASWVQAGVPAGMVLATGVFKLFYWLLPHDQFVHWGWRIPFLLGILLLCVGLFIRLRILESPLFARMRDRKQEARVPFFEVLRRYPRNVVLAIGARLAENGSYYILTVFVLTYIKDKFPDASDAALTGVIIASALQFFVIPVYGILSDRVGRRPVYLAGALGLAAFAFPFFWMLDTGNATIIVLAIVFGLAVQSLMYAPQAAFFAELFGTEVRYTGASIGYHLAAPLAGGVAPLISIGLLEWSGRQSWPIAVYMILLAAITLVSVWLAAETHQTRLGEHEHEEVD